MDRFFICGVEIDADAFWNIDATGYATEENDQGGVDFKIEKYDIGE